VLENVLVKKMGNNKNIWCGFPIENMGIGWGYSLLSSPAAYSHRYSICLLNHPREGTRYTATPDKQGERLREVLEQEIGKTG